VTVQGQVQTQDPSTLAVAVTWADVIVDEPAEFVPLSGREFVQANAVAAEIDARCTIRWRSDVSPTMRVVFDGGVYEIAAVLPDPSARRWLTLMVQFVEPKAS
jgi:SPP1 family predicted phage head-tail adaptor